MKKSIFQTIILPSIFMILCFEWSCKKNDPEPRPIPKGIIFKSWSLEDVKETNKDGRIWDVDSTGPDIKLYMYQSGGPFFYESEVIPDALPGKKYDVDIEPDIRIDSLTSWWYLIENEYDPFLGSETIKMGSIDMGSLFLEPDHVSVNGGNLKIIWRVEYLY